MKIPKTSQFFFVCVFLFLFGESKSDYVTSKRNKQKSFDKLWDAGQII